MLLVSAVGPLAVEVAPSVAHADTRIEIDKQSNKFLIFMTTSLFSGCLDTRLARADPIVRPNRFF